MKISDEIREWCDDDKHYCDGLWTLRSLADRIDREMVELPRDKDWAPVHLGDTVWSVDDGMEFTVTSITLYADGAAKVDASCYGCDAHTSPKDLTHTNPDSLERIADELEVAEKWCDQNGDYGTGISSIGSPTLHEWADRIRKLAKEGER